MAVHFEALGLMLLHFCWQGLIIAGVAKGFTRMSAKLSARSLYTLHLCALLAMTLTALITFVYEDVRLTHLHDGVQTLALVEPAKPLPVLAGDMTITQVLPWLDILWACGVLLLSLRTLGGLWRIQRLAKGALPVPADLAARFARTLRLHGLQNVRLRLHPGIDGPFVVGLFRSVVYLPLSAVSALSPDQLDAVLGHELEHIRRADFAWNLLQTAVETLFFYHPAVWWLCRTLREQREQACDDVAVQVCQDPLTYATALLNLEEQRLRSPSPKLAMALNGHDRGPSLLSRIARVLGETPITRRAASPRPLVVIVPLVLATLAAFAIPAAQVAASTNGAAKTQCKIKATEAVAGGSSPALSLPKDEEAHMAVAGEEQTTEEAPAPEATEADIEPKDFWTGLRPNARASAQGHRAEVSDEAEMSLERAWAGWAQSTQRWADLAKGSFDESTKAQIEAEALQEAAEDLRREAEALRRQNDVNADEMERQAAKINAQAKRAQAEAERTQRAADAAARRAETQGRSLRPLTELTPPAPPSAPEAVATPDPVAPASPVHPIAPVPLAIQTQVKVKMPKVVFVKPALAKAASTTVTLNQLPSAVAVAIPAPDIKTDVVVNVRREMNIQVAVAR